MPRQTIGGFEVPLTDAKEEFDELPTPGDSFDFNGTEHLITAVKVIERFSKDPVLMIELEPVKGYRVHSDVRGASELRAEARNVFSDFPEDTDE